MERISVSDLQVFSLLRSLSGWRFDESVRTGALMARYPFFGSYSLFVCIRPLMFCSVISSKQSLLTFCLSNSTCLDCFSYFCEGSARLPVWSSVEVVEKDLWEESWRELKKLASLGECGIMTLCRLLERSVRCVDREDFLELNRELPTNTGGWNGCVGREGTGWQADQVHFCFIPLSKIDDEYLYESIVITKDTSHTPTRNRSSYLTINRLSTVRQISLSARILWANRYQFLFNSRRIMSILKAVLLLSLVIALTYSVVLDSSPSPSVGSQYVPIPKRYPGLSTGAVDGPITIELIYDPTCDGSQELDHKIRDVVAGLDAATLAKLNIRFAINILPYHITSEKIAMAVRYVADNQGHDEAVRVLRFFLDNIDRWDEKSISKVSINEFLNNLAGQVSALTGLSRTDIRTELAHGSNTDRLTRQWSKYVMGSLRIPGTPFLFINGVRIDGAGDKDASQLTALIKSLL